MTNDKVSIGIVIIVVSLLVLAMFALGSSPPKVQCPMPSVDNKEHLVGVGYNILARKYWKTFDLDNDLREDYHVEYDITGVKPDRTLKISTFPTVYYLDLDKDGVYEVIYVDTQGSGRCEDLRTYTGREVQQ